MDGCRAYLLFVVGGVARSIARRCSHIKHPEQTRFGHHLLFVVVTHMDMPLSSAPRHLHEPINDLKLEPEASEGLIPLKQGNGELVEVCQAYKGFVTLIHHTLTVRTDRVSDVHWLAWQNEEIPHVVPICVWAVTLVFRIATAAVAVLVAPDVAAWRMMGHDVLLLDGHTKQTLLRMLSKRSMIPSLKKSSSNNLGSPRDLTPYLHHWGLVQNMVPNLWDCS